MFSAVEFSDDSEVEDGPALRLARRFRRLCGASLYVGGACPGRSRIPSPNRAEDSRLAELKPYELSARTLCTGELCVEKDDTSPEPMSSDKDGPKVRDGAPVTAVEVMRACVREGLAGRVAVTDIFGGDESFEFASGTAWMKQQRLPYGQLPWFQNVRQISDLNCKVEV